MIETARKVVGAERNAELDAKFDHKEQVEEEEYDSRMEDPTQRIRTIR